LRLIADKLDASHSSGVPVVMHGTLDKLLKNCKSGDKVFIFPGVYVCDALPWIEFDIEISGIAGKREEIVLEASESVGDIFLNCSANAILISNLTLRTSAETHCIVMIHSGLTNLTNCLLDGGMSARNSIIALSKAEVALDDCKILHDGEQSGIVSRPGSNVTLEGAAIGQDISHHLLAESPDCLTSSMDIGQLSDEDNNAASQKSVSGDMVAGFKKSGK